MAAKKCGCFSPTCGCCEGTRKITPVSTANRPGLEFLNYRIGTHGAFFETMKARLGNMVVEAPGTDGQTIETFYPLQSLTTRDPSDPAIALLDGWATVADVLTFYQERIANEGYLRTATERRSILELARLVGYTLRPGVAATVILANTLEDTQAGPVEIPTGSRSQSIPGPGELPQSFETSENLTTAREWNNLQVRLSKPQKITIGNAWSIARIFVKGISTNLKTGDQLLLVFGEQGTPSVLRTVAGTLTQPTDDRTEIQLQALSGDLLQTLPLLATFTAAIRPLVIATSSRATRAVLETADRLLESAYLGRAMAPAEWSHEFSHRILITESTVDEPVLTMLGDFEAKVEDVLNLPGGPPPPRVVTDPDQLVPFLLKARIPQPRSSLQFNRSLKEIFKPGKDVQPQLLVNFAPELKDTFYNAWASADVNSAQPELKAVCALRLQAPLFGASVTKQPTYYTADEPEAGNKVTHVKGELKAQNFWIEWELEGETDNSLYLDQAHDEILPLGYVVIQKPFNGGEVREAHQVVTAQATQRTAYGISGKTTRLTFGDNWWTTQFESDISETLRHTLVFAQSEQFELVDEPITDPVQLTDDDTVSGSGIELGALYKELVSGRWVILSGERSDVPNATGVKASELLMIAGLKYDFDPALPGDKAHTTLLFATETAYSYKRNSLKIYGNVVKATHGETTNETLGSGDGSQALQSFGLKQPPLTFVPAANASGVESTLHVYVNNVEWHETETLAGLEPRDRKFTTKTDDVGNTTVIFGNGKEGSRLPTGVLNVSSTYRKGIGKGGNVVGEQVSLLQTKPLGVKSVINPLRASGGADKEDRDQARENAPLAVMALDRLVSLQDYADFTRTFAGIAKASVRQLSDRRRQFIHLTIAGVDDIPIDPVSDLYRNLLGALSGLGDVSVAVQVDSRELIILVLSANIRLEPDYLWDPVAAAVRAALFEKFGFRKRALGQAALLCEIVGCIQSIAGVAYVDVDAFGGIAEKVTGTDGTRRLRTLDEMSLTVQGIVGPVAGGSAKQGDAAKTSQIVGAGLADHEGGALRPAQLAIFTPAVPDTMVLNQIK